MTRTMRSWFGPGARVGVALLLAIEGRAGALAATLPLPAPPPKVLLIGTATTAPAAVQPPAALPPDAVLPQGGELSADALLAQVLARNPSLDQMTAAWHAASARYPQAISLEDPMFGVQDAPGAIGSNTVDGGYRIEISQKYPWPGKRALRGQNAQAEASAAGHEVDDMRLQLIESARDALADYYLVHRALEVNDENLKLLQQARSDAEARYKKPGMEKTTLQDLLQIDVELGQQRQRQLSLERMRKVAIGKLNTLMHQTPDAPLPTAPAQLPSAGPLPAVQALREQARDRRPDLLALGDRIKAEQASLALAHKEYCPDMEWMAAYDSFWHGTDNPLRAQVGLRINLPVRLAKRDAAVAEAESRIQERVAELYKQTDQALFEVEQAYAQVSESEQTVHLYEDKILKDARTNVEAAQPGYRTGTIPVLSLIEAERSLTSLRDQYYEAVADLYRRRAALERAAGGPLDEAAAPDCRAHK